MCGVGGGGMGGGVESPKMNKLQDQVMNKMGRNTEKREKSSQENRLDRHGGFFSQ